MFRIQKLLCLMLCLCLVLCHVPAVFAQEGDAVVQISSLEEFLTFVENCRLDSYSRDKYFQLTVDLDLTGVAFDGISTFGGTFDGTNHTISGLNLQGAGSVKGLFRYVESTAVVKDLSVVGNIIPTGSREQVGGIAGNNAGRIENCRFSGTVTGAGSVGGIAGINEASGVIKGCEATGTISGYHFVGGIAGSNGGTVAQCRNSAGVNISAQQNDIDISDITMGSLTNTESIAATTDIGGIAGFSKGIIRGCVNEGTIGYQHMGYNVGGIVGVQTGYVVDCVNMGAVSGRKEVGGIVGQQEPQVILRYDTDTLQILEGQLGVLSGLIDEATANTNANTTQIRNLLYKLERYVADMENALDYLKSGLEDPKLADLQSYADALQTIADSLAGMSNTMRKLWDQVDETMTDLQGDMQAIAEQMAHIEDTLNNAEDNLGGVIVDISDEDTQEDLGSKIENCQNLGAVLADLNAGGIVGSVSFENDLDPEQDITIVGSTTLNACGSLRSVILGCANSAAVTVKNQYAGGIVGSLSLGLIKDCVNTGNLLNDTASYVGGIAGDCAGFIRDCKVKCVISGKSSVGGIAGQGAVVSDSFAMVQISGTEKVGAVLGIAQAPRTDVEDPITGNYYLRGAQDIGAIDGISYEGKAQGLSQEDFLRAQSDCEIFCQVTVIFQVDGEVVIKKVLPAGRPLKNVPPVPEKEGYSGQWGGMDEADLECLLFDLCFTAEYTAHSATVQSDLTDEKGRPYLLLQGDFSVGAALQITQLQSLAAIREGQTLLMAWELRTEQCVALQAGRLLIPKDTDLEDVILLVRDANGNWTERAYSRDGSYIHFALAHGDDGVALLRSPHGGILSTEILIAAGVGAVTVLVIVLLCLGVTKAKRKKKGR